MKLVRCQLQNQFLQQKNFYLIWLVHIQSHDWMLFYGAISSLEFMVDDLKEREYKNIEIDSEPLEAFAIEDIGSGFSEEAIKNLFKKGFTTKQSGSGLGLSFCLEKIREWGGFLYVDPTSKKTRIEIELSVCEKSASFAHPLILADLNDAIIIDDHPMENDNSW